MAPDVELPAEAVGRDGAPIPVCWLCAHLITAHDVELGGCAPANYTMCTCSRETIYPERTWPAVVPDVDPEDTRLTLELELEIRAAQSRLDAALRARERAQGVTHASSAVSARKRSESARKAAATRWSGAKAAGRSGAR